MGVCVNQTVSCCFVRSLVISSLLQRLSLSLWW